ncbi:MAG: purine-nucleoside phosphorylase [Sphaerobacter sp.]|nr:purine-nucleoside phosphorylase [Sphaerobacter sp.]
MTDTSLSAWLAASGLAPRTALVLGSGLAPVVAALEVVARAPMDDLFGVHVRAVAGHAREVVVGYYAGVPVLAYCGRYHLYQGLTAAEVAAPIRALQGTPVRQVVLTNAAGGLNPDFAVGDLMLLRDHLSLPGFAGQSPLIPPRGPAVDFVSMREAYSPALRAQAHRAAAAAGLTLREGVYVMVAGPSYETAAELRFLRAVGGDAVGMSTVPEVVMARALGLDVLAISTITNRAVADEPAAPTHEEVLRAGQRAAARLAALLARLLPSLPG